MTSKVNARSNELDVDDSEGCILDTTVEHKSETSSTKQSEASIEKSPMKGLTNFEIPEPIQALDDILSQFEEPESIPLNQGSCFHENHSEDDGYMSLNGRRCDVNNMRLLQNAQKLRDTAMDIAKYQNFVKRDASHTNIEIHIQNTLPKTKSKLCTKSNYSSLPCSSIRSNLLEDKTRVGSCSGERNILGIDISAVHNAVLRGGVAKLPEPIVNEHPITIYPGRKSPNWITRSPRSALCSVPTQKENCHKSKHNLNPQPLPLGRKRIIAKNEDKEIIADNENEKNQFEENDLKELQSFEMHTQITFDKECNFSSNLIAISAPAKPKKLNSIAWDINFDENKKIDVSKLTKKIKDKNLKHKGQESYSNINSKQSATKGSLKEYTSEEEVQKPNANITLKSYNETFFNDLTETNDPLVIYDIKDNTSNHNSAYDSMLGKGTFIIRKRQVQSSNFLNIRKPLIVQYQNGKTVSTNNNEYSEDSETSPILKDPVTNLSRARLSLDLEPDHLAIVTCNQINQYQSPLAEESLSEIATHEQLSDSLYKTAKKLYSSSSIDNIGQDPKDLPQNVERICSEYNPTILDISKKKNETYLKGDKDASQIVNLTHNKALVKVSNDLRSPGPIEHISSCTTPHRELAPPLEEEEEPCSESQSGCAPLRQIEHNISALLRGDISVVRIGDSSKSRRTLNYRPGVHKSESAKEMLLSQNAFGPLPPSPPSSSPEVNDCDSLPPLPPSPSGTDIDDNILDTESIFIPVEIRPSQSKRDSSEVHNKKALSKYHLNDIPLPPLPYEHLPPAVPPHRGSSNLQAIRSRSIDSNYIRKCPIAIPHSGSSVITTGYNSSASTCDTAFASRRNIGSYGNKKNIRQSPREEQRLQTSCSLPETPIFSRGCDIARTPYRRQTENTVGSGSRTAPRSTTSQASNMGSSIIGISGGNTLGVGVCRQRTITHVLASGEMLRLSGGPARGWYPKHRAMRPASTENIDRLPQSHSHSASMRVWDTAQGVTPIPQMRKPLTLPPNLTPSFLNKSPREALRRVTSLLINKKGASKERENKISKENMSQPTVTPSRGTTSTCKITSQELSSRPPNHKSHKKKGFFKQFWKKSKHYSFEQ